MSEVTCGLGTKLAVTIGSILLFIEHFLIVTAFLLLCVSIADSVILRHNRALVAPSEGETCVCVHLPVAYVFTASGVLVCTCKPYNINTILYTLENIQ